MNVRNDRGEVRDMFDVLIERAIVTVRPSSNMNITQVRKCTGIEWVHHIRAGHAVLNYTLMKLCD